MEGRSLSISSNYRYGFQNQEQDDEINGKGNSINYKYRVHDPRIGRFLSVDPLTASYPFYTPYSFSGNRVIDAVELEGLEPEIGAGTVDVGSYEIASDNETGKEFGWTSDGENWRRGLEVVEIEGKNSSTGNAIEKQVVTTTAGVGDLRYKGKVEDAIYFTDFNLEDNLGAASGEFRLVGGSAYNYTGTGSLPVNFPLAISLGAEGALANAKVDIRQGPELLAIIGGAEGSFASFEANIDAGILSGENNRYGLLYDYNVGAYTAEGEVYAGGSILGIKYKQIAGGSTASAHIGYTAGFYYDENISNIHLIGLEHVGFGAGQKFGFEVEIPFKPILNHFISDK